MSEAVVIDASVAVKWLFAEEHSANARALLRSRVFVHQEAVAPLLLRSEMTNAVYQKARRNEATLEEAEQALSFFLGLPIEFVAPENLFSSALTLAAQYNLGATYDAQYLALSRVLDTEFWTADMKLVRAVSAKWIRWIGDHPAAAPDASSE